MQKNSNSPDSDVATKFDDKTCNVLEIASPFAFAIWQNQTELCQPFLAKYPLDRQLTKSEIQQLVRTQFRVNDFLQVSDVDNIDNIGNTEENNYLDETEVMHNLRQLRKLLMLRWIWQDALNAISVQQLTEQLSDFADSCIIHAKDFTFSQLVQKYGRPSFRNKPSKNKAKLNYDDMAIFAMGKLGAGELNLSSDIDLIFVHRAQGETDTLDTENLATKRKCIENQKFMTKLGQGIIKILDSNTKDGFVFRVDMRLRPWGDGSALVTHQSALNNYLTKNGRAWERFAWLKARVVNEIDDDFQQSLEQVIKPFIFKHYVDYSAFASLREMKTLIENQVAQREDLNNVKLGAGGIRDIEFIVQAYQLIYGGRYHELQVKPCLQAMSVLSDMSYLDAETYQQLQQAYLFLRRLEHGIQAMHDKQTQSLPTEAPAQHNLASSLGFADWQSLMMELSQHRENVNKPFNKLVKQRQDNAPINHGKENLQAQLLEILNVDNQKKLEDFNNSKLVNNLSSTSKQHLELAYPILLQALCIHEEELGTANIAFPRLLQLLEAICKRSIYLIMLAENPNATIALIPVLSSSPWIAQELTRYPVLLDTFIQQRYHHLPSKAELSDIMRQRLLRVEPNDEENLLSVLRLFKKMQVLAVAASDIVDKKSIMKVSDSLTYIAEVVLDTTLKRVFAELVRQHGYPINNQGEALTDADCGFAIIGYGKLGGFELSYSSDLDLVFLHALNEQAMSNGAKPISGMKFAARLARKMMTYLATQTRDGRAYEIDTRLRPSGNLGMMVVSAKAFEKYQTDQAWYWEHQALVRARAICGDKQLMQEFSEIRHRVLAKQRDIDTLRKEVVAMRIKMRNHLGSKASDVNEAEGIKQPFQLKHDSGGMVDIEFMAQYAVLAHAHQYKQIIQWTDNIRIFEQLAVDGVWSEQMCQNLINDYLTIRIATHKLSLQNKKKVVEKSDWTEVNERVQGYWQALLE